MSIEPPESIYKAMVQVGNCMRCGNSDDLRFGACFTCSERIDGEMVPGGHRLWDKDNPANFWFVSTKEH